MARDQDWQREIREETRREPASSAWSSVGPNRLVKVTRLSAIFNSTPRARAIGYVTQEKYLFGKMCPVASPSIQQMPRRRALDSMKMLHYERCRITQLATDVSRNGK